MRRIVLCLLVCAVCAFCLGAEVQEVSKGEQKLPGYEVWSVREVRRFTDNDGGRFREVEYYTLRVYLDGSGRAFMFEAYDQGAQLMWDATPPVEPRPWNDFSAKKAYVCFNCESLLYYGRLVGHLKLNRSWTRATGKIVAAVWFGKPYPCEGRVKAEYLYYQP